jgi:hypothetical protein
MGLIAWAVSGEVTIGLILLVATGTALGVTFESSVDTRLLTAHERRWVLILAGTGVIVGTLMFGYVVLFRSDSVDSVLDPSLNSGQTVAGLHRPHRPRYRDPHD